MRIMQWSLFIVLSLLLTFLLAAIPFSEILKFYRPQWFILWVVFCQLQYPRQFNPWYAWCAGLLCDALFGTLLGLHAFIFSLIAYLTALLRSRFVGRPFWQQIGKVGILVCLGQILLLWFHVFMGHNPGTLWYWMSTITSCAIWPLWVGVLNTLTRVLGIAPYTTRTVLS